jgi:Tat protein translocase TatB subunit
MPGPLEEEYILNLFGLSPGELILIMMVAMVVIGPEKLPETAASIGKWVREFRRVTTELTQQFADENPFTEIQRAFSLTELTNSLNAPLPGSESVVVPAEATEASPEASVVTATAVVAPITTPARSVYFDQPALSVAIEDSWTHSGLDESYARHGVGRRLEISEAIVDEWAHGVPIFDPPPPVVDLPSDEPGSTELAAAGETIAAVPTDESHEVAPPEPELADVDHDESSANVSTAATDPYVYEPVAVGAASSTGRS